jgi:spindle assembly abnormal protein 6
MSVSGPSVLNVVETNPFRHLNHLSLKFISASDAYLKKYLAECLLGLKVF